MVYFILFLVFAMLGFGVGPKVACGLIVKLGWSSHLGGYEHGVSDKHIILFISLYAFIFKSNSIVSA